MVTRSGGLTKLLISNLDYGVSSSDIKVEHSQCILS